MSKFFVALLITLKRLI